MPRKAKTEVRERGAGRLNPAGSVAEGVGRRQREEPEGPGVHVCAERGDEASAAFGSALYEYNSTNTGGNRQDLSCCTSKASTFVLVRVRERA